MAVMPHFFAFAAAPGWLPFLEPLDLHDYWLWLQLPLLIAVAVVIKTLKLRRLEDLASETARLTIFILFIEANVAVLLWLVVRFV